MVHQELHDIIINTPSCWHIGAGAGRWHGRLRATGGKVTDHTPLIISPIYKYWQISHFYRKTKKEI